TRELSADEFEQNLHALADRFAEIGTLPVLQTTCLTLPDPGADRDLDDYMQRVRDAAAARGLPLIDHAAHWHACSEGRLYYWMSDTIHPNELGHRVFARHLFESLNIFDPRSPTCSLFIPCPRRDRPRRTRGRHP